MNESVNRHVYGRALLFLLALSLSGCVSFNYSNNPVETWMLAGNPDQALLALEDRSDRRRDQVVYLLDKAMLLRMKGEFQASNEAFEMAKRINEKLDAISFREQVGAMSLNESVKSYFSPPFERTMLHIYEALNYLEMGDTDSARVEIMQLNVLTKAVDHEETLALSHYFSGLVFDHLGEYSDALIEYRKAYQRYNELGLTLPTKIKDDLLRLTEAQGLSDENRKFQKAFNQSQWPAQRNYLRQGELVLFLSNGIIPRKHDQSITVQDPKNGQLHRIATPFYERRKPTIDHAKIITGDESTTTQLAEALDVDAVAALNKEMPKIIARAIARVSIKNKIVDNARDSDPLLGAIINIAGIITEQADTRAWSTLPQQVLIGRLTLNPGTYDVEVDFISSDGQKKSTKVFYSVEIKPGKKTFVSAYQPLSHVINRRDYR